MSGGGSLALGGQGRPAGARAGGARGETWPPCRLHPGEVAGGAGGRGAVAEAGGRGRGGAAGGILVEWQGLQELGCFGAVRGIS